MCYLITRVMRGVLSHHTFVRTGCAILPHVCVIGDVWYGILYLITCLLGRGVLSYHMCVIGYHHTCVRRGGAILSHVCYRVCVILSHLCYRVCVILSHVCNRGCVILSHVC